MLSRDPRMNRAAQALQPPSPPGTPVVSSPGAATGFNGLTHADQRNAGTGQYVNTQFSLEPPDQGLCVGHGFVIEPVNDAFAVYNESGARLTAPTALNQFYNRSPAINRTTGATGDFLSDPKCYWDPVGHRFIQTILEVDAPGNFSGAAPFNRTHVLIAVSQTSDPTGKWNLYSMDTSDDGLNGTPAHTGCPCLPDQPLLGANRDGVFIDTNEFQDNPSFFFNGGQIYGLGRAALESGASSVVFTHLDVGTVPTGDPNLPFWGSIQPSESINPPGGTELLMTGGPEDIFQNNAPLDNRIAAWSLAGTRSLGSSHPSLQLSHQVLTSETYGLPINTGATQKPGPTPLGTSLGEPLETINANDSRMNQVVDLNGVLFGGVNTTVTSATGPPRVGIAYFAVGAVGTPAGDLRPHPPPGLCGRERRERPVPLDRGEPVWRRRDGLYPERARLLPERRLRAVRPGPGGRLDSRQRAGCPAGRRVLRLRGRGVPDAWRGPLGRLLGRRYGDGAIWMGNEFIPNAPRTLLANWGTFVSRLPA
jgi:hypothetical protein